MGSIEHGAGLSDMPAMSDWPPTSALPRQNDALYLVGIYEISKILTSSVNLPASLRAVLNLMGSYLDLRHGVVAIVNDRGEPDIVAAASITPRDLSRGHANLPREVAARILGGQMAYVTENAADDPLLASYVGATGLLEDERVSFIGVPIKTFDRPFGILAVARVSDAETVISIGEDIRFLTMVANLIAQTVKLHQKTEARTGAAKPRDSMPEVEEAPHGVPLLDNVIGRSRAMQEVFAQVHLVAPTRSTVIVRGESGTGKEMIARAVHALSARRNGPFIKVNCAALPDSLLESELFGHEKGSFTGATQDRKGRFELANGGTMFLDEIGDISTAFQAKLLRVLQEREFERVGGTKTLKVDVRLVCATNKNLEEAVAKGDFRADLYYRINVVPVFMPALRERRSDIPILAQHFLELFNRENERNLAFSDRALKILSSCSFPGNVRELENCVYRMATMTRGEHIDEANVPCMTESCFCPMIPPQTAFAQGPVATVPLSAVSPIRSAAPAAPLPGAAADAGAFNGDADWNDIDDLADDDAVPQRDRLIRVMEKTGWVQAKAARLLGLTPRQVGYALRKYNIPIKRL